MEAAARGERGGRRFSSRGFCQQGQLGSGVQHVLGRCQYRGPLLCTKQCTEQPANQAPCLQLQLATRQPTVAPRRPQCEHLTCRPRLIAASTQRSVPWSVSYTCGKQRQQDTRVSSMHSQQCSRLQAFGGRAATPVGSGFTHQAAPHSACATHLGAPHSAYPVHKQIVCGVALAVPNGAKQRAQVDGGGSRGGTQRTAAVKHLGLAACTPRPAV